MEGRAWRGMGVEKVEEERRRDGGEEVGGKEGRGGEGRRLEEKREGVEAKRHGRGSKRKKLSKLKDIYDDSCRRNVFL